MNQNLQGWVQGTESISDMILQVILKEVRQSLVHQAGLCDPLI